MDNCFLIIQACFHSIHIRNGMNCTDPNTSEYLPVLTCQVMDLDEHTTCSETDSNSCLICPIIGKFLIGENLHDVYSIGHIVCIFLWIFTVFIGVVGVFTNILIIIVTRRMNTQRPFDILVMFLASFDMLCCAFAFIGTSAHVALYRKLIFIWLSWILIKFFWLICFLTESWVDKSFLTMHWFYLFNQATLLGKKFTKIIYESSTSVNLCMSSVFFAYFQAEQLQPIWQCW